MLTLKSFFTFLSRNKLYTAINLFGLAISLTFVVLIACYSSSLYSYDQFHTNKDNVFMLAMNDPDNGGYITSWPAPVASDLKGMCPEVVSTCRLGYNWRNAYVKVFDKQFSTNLQFADSTFFTMLSYQLVDGNAKEVLQGLDNVAISKTFAQKSFGNINPIGKTVQIEGVDYLVNGVFSDLSNTFIRPADLVIRFENFWRSRESLPHEGDWLTQYGYCNWALLLQTQKGTSLDHKADLINDYLKEHFSWINKEPQMKLIPLADIHFSNLNSNGFIGNRQNMIIVLNFIALLILAFAVINYINLSVAQSEFRAREMATRRLLGGHRGALVFRLIVESTLMCFVALVLALNLAYAIQPLFSQIMNRTVDIMQLLSPINLAILATSVLILGVINGLIPALVITNHKPVEVVRGQITTKSKMIYSKLLICVQLFITIAIVASTIIVSKQMQKMTTGMGYNTTGIICIDEGIESNQLSVLKNELLSIAGVEEVAMTQGTPFDGGNDLTTKYNGHILSTNWFIGDSSFYRMMNFKVLKDYQNASPNAVWLNETAFRQMELTDTSTCFITMGQTYAIAGIIKDYVFRDMRQDIKPAIIHIKPEIDQIWGLLIKVSSLNVSETYNRIGEKYSRICDNKPFEGRFATEIILAKYSKEQQTLQILRCLSGVAILIAALGIFAMATYFIKQRKMEIAIRKVFGATSSSVLTRIIGQFSVWVLVGTVVAIPVIWYAMETWLQNYTYRITIGAMPFVVASIIALIISVSTVFWQSHKAANANPIDSIKR